MICSEETRSKISATLKGKMAGEKNPFYGKHHSPETRLKLAEISRNHRHSPEALEKLRIAGYRRKQTKEARAKVAKAQLGNKHGLGTRRAPETRMKQSIAQQGERGSNWQGGKSYEPYCPKWTEDLRRRIRAFFEYLCVTCGKSTAENKRKLSCHHVSYDKQVCCNEKPVRFAALCNKCHCESSMDRDRWEAMLHRIIEEIYDGKSYFTKEEWVARGMT